MQGYNVYNDILDAYLKLDLHQLQLFLRIRSLPTSGSISELAARLANYDVQAFQIPVYKPATAIPVLSTSLPKQLQAKPEAVGPSMPRSHLLANLPIDLITEILDHLGEWELSKAVGVPTSLVKPADWANSATFLDYAILSTSLSRVRAAPFDPPFTQLGAKLLIAFELIDVLEYLWNIPALRPTFKKYYGDDFSTIPKLASSYNRTRMLDWWLAQLDIQPKSYTTEAIHDACRYVCLDALKWWDYKSKQSVEHSTLKYVDRLQPRLNAPGSPFPFPPLYTSQALETASHKANLAVLNFFRAHGWPLLPGRSLDMASSAGHVDVLDWWAYESGLEIGKDVKYDKNAVYSASCGGKVDVLQWWKEQSERGNGKVQMLFDGDALIGATRLDKPEVLEWWDKSGLPITYRIFDIEEALEDAIGGGPAARAWWSRKGVNFRAGDSEWMKTRSLN
ncbi:hypothetical protein M422DRAFT_239716 [Sphaerobolus stellatus SS14]|nr:hypothetical protein M422DRAFT_239716 [Sphaerobolus stellatus SS14]